MPIKTKTHDFVQTIKIEVPYIASFPDYHDIDDEAWNMRKRIENNKFKGEEIDVEIYGYQFPGEYYGVFWIGRKPTKAQIRELLKDEDLELFEDTQPDGGAHNE